MLCIFNGPVYFKSSSCQEDLKCKIEETFTLHLLKYREIPNISHPLDNKVFFCLSLCLASCINGYKRILRDS